MRLEDGVDPGKIAQLRCRQGRADLRGMMTVVVDHGDPPRCATLLKPAVDAGESRNRFPNLLDAYFQFETHCNSRSRIEHVVDARHTQVKLAELAPTRAN